MCQKIRKLQIITIIATISSCKRISSQSEVASLENYTAADGSVLVKNTCQGPYENVNFSKLETIDAPHELHPTVQKTLSAVPLSIRELFNTSLIGKITVTDAAESLCREATKNLSEERLKTGQINTRSCLRADPGEPGVELIIPAEKSAIEHGLVRAYFSTVFTTMSESKFHKELKIFVADKKQSELEAIETRIQNALKSDLANKQGINTNMFKDPVDGVIEAADQYYCSKSTRDQFRQKFPATYQVFKSNYVSIIHESGEKNPEEIYQEVVGENTKSFGLWGRWGPGNGPLRAWGRSRIAARQQGGRGLFPRWNLARQRGYQRGGVGPFPNWQLSRQSARQSLRKAGYPGTSLFPNYWANRLSR